MRRIVIALAVVAVLFSAGLSYGGEQEQTGVPEEVLKELSFMVGKWETKMFENGVEVGTATHERKWAPGGHCLIMTWLGEKDGVKIHGTAVSGWNAKTKQVVEHWYCSDGIYVSIHYPFAKMTEDAWVGSASVVEADGKVYREKCRLYKGKDQWVFTSVREVAGQKVTLRNVTRKVKE